MRVSVVLAIVFAIVFASGIASADPGYRVIVNPDNPSTRLERRFIAEAFLKKRTRWDEDTAIVPVDQPENSPVRARFSEDVLGRSVANVKRYWTQLVFSGRGVPPPELDNDKAIVDYVASHRGAMGYVSMTADLGKTKVVVVE